MDNLELEELVDSAFMSFDNYHYQRKPFNVSCKCHICGDSRKDKSQSRLNAYYYRDEIMVNCYNCGFSSGVKYYLRTYHPNQWSIYSDKVKSSKLMALQKQRIDEIDKDFIKKGKYSTIDDILGNIETMEEEVEEEIIFPTELPLCYRIDEIDEEHPVVDYVKSRMIPRDKWHRLFFTTEFRKLANIVSPGTYHRESPEPRLVIPIYNREGRIESFQGRALREGSGMRYLTIKYCEEATKIYGLDTMDDTKTVYLMEGQIDSLFIENGLAITGGNISLEDLDELVPRNRAFIMDHEDRHPDTIQRIQKLLDGGESIVLFDKTDWKGKDINQFVENGISIEEINSYIKENTLSGLHARMRFNDWAKVDLVRVKRERRERYRNDKREEAMNQLFESIKKGH